MSHEIKIGGCRLINGNCLEVMPKLRPVDHVFADGPYEEATHKALNAKSVKRSDGGAELRGVDFDAIDEIREDVVSAVANICQGWFLTFCTPEGVRPWADAINASSIRYKRACVWVKPDAAPQFNGQGPAAGAENFIVAWAGKGCSRWNAGGKRGVYTKPCNPPDRHGGHPTEKPWRLMRDLIHDFTNPGDVILDPFMGSGTTLVAAMLSGRRAIGIEQNPEYFEMARLRVEKARAQVRALGPQFQEEVQEVLL